MREAMADVKRQAAASPSAEDFAKEAGATIQYNGDGSWTGTVRGTENIRRAVQMQGDARKVAMERSEKLHASRPEEVLVDGDGRRMSAPVHLAEQIAKQRGLKPKRFYGKPSARWVARNGELVRVL